MKHIVLIMFFVITAKICTSQTHIQTATNTSLTKTVAKKFLGASTSGNLIVVELTWDNQVVDIASMTDSKGNSYAKISGPTNWNGTNYVGELWYSYNITGGTKITITATLNGTPTSFLQMYMSEYSGINTATDPLDQNSVNTGNVNAISSGAKTTVYSNELVYGASVGAGSSITTGAGFTQRSNANGNIIEDKNVSAIGSYSSDFTETNGDWIAQMATFRSTSAMPIELISFDGSADGAVNDINWNVATQTNNDKFVIDKSSDALNWITLTTINGAGNSSEAITYSCTDNNPYAITYYKLTQFDFDGKSQMFNIIPVNNNYLNKNISVYPNPFKNYITIEISVTIETNYDIRVFGMGGSVLFSKNVPVESGTFTYLLDTSTFPAGIYSISIVSLYSSLSKTIVKY